jgi:prepilin-type N-terminal cleavage/methylation domain-containing protein
VADRAQMQEALPRRKILSRRYQTANRGAKVRGLLNQKMMICTSPRSVDCRRDSRFRPCLPAHNQREMHRAAFTLMELLAVILIVAILMGMLFPMISSVKQSGRKSQAAGEVTRIAAAVHAFHTE